MEKYKYKSTQELENLFINACINPKKDDYKLVIDLFTLSELKNNINPALIKQTVLNMEQEKPFKHGGLYLYIRDISNYLEEKEKFSKDYFLNLSGMEYVELVNNTIQFGDLKNLDYLLTEPQLKHHSQYIVFNQNVLRKVVHSGHPEILHYFLSSNIEKNITIHKDEALFFRDSCIYGHTGIVDYLLNKLPYEMKPPHSKFASSFLDAAKNGNLDIVKLLVDANSSLNEPYDFGYALTLASEDNNPDVVKYLLTLPQSQTNFDQLTYQRVFHDACHFGNIKFAKYLLESPELTTHANLNETIGEYDGYSYNSAITAAIHGEKLEVLKFLVFDMNADRPTSITEFLDDDTSRNLHKMFELREITKQLNEELDTSKSDTQTKKIKL